MATKGMETLDAAALQAMLGPGLTADQAALIFQQGQDAVVFALLTLAKQLAEKQALASAPDPSTPSGQTPPYVKTASTGRAKARGAKPGHPGHRRPPPPRIDRREGHELSTCPKCQGRGRPCRSTRTRVIEDIPADITPVVTEHTIHRYWCPQCRDTVEPVVPDALPGSTIGLRVVVLSAWLHYLRGTTLAQIVDVFNFHLQSKLSSGGLVQMWHRLREIVLAWYLEIRAQALDSAVLHADETGWRVNGETYWLWCFTSKDVTYYMIDRRRGSPALKKFGSCRATAALSGTSCIGVLAAFAVSFGRISPDTAEPLRPDWRGGVRAAVRVADARSRLKDHEPGRSTNPARAFSISSRWPSRCEPRSRFGRSGRARAAPTTSSGTVSRNASTSSAVFRAISAALSGGIVSKNGSSTSLNNSPS
ncbi:MAG: IS66 family transposase [Planctomycetaceae bacterium]